MRDVARLLNDMLAAGAVHSAEVEKLAAAHGLTPQWKAFRKRFLDA
ncbi:MAG: hypothetical protein JXB04_02465 [Kiritimatiellae bacterium]|nr:hypothetical protein [Kiritimatiellia bacterium]